MSGFRLLWTIAWTRTVRTYRHPLNLLWLILLPLVFSLGAGRIFMVDQGPPRVVVVDEDGTPAAQALIEGLRETPYDVSLMTREDAERQVLDGRVGTAVVIPAGFARSVESGHPRLEILQGPSLQHNGAEGRAMALARALAAGQTVAAPPVEVETPRPSADPDQFPLMRIFWGIYTMFALATGLQGAAGLHEERAQGTLQRTLTLGVPYAVILAGHGLSLVLVGLVQALVFFTVTGLAGAGWLAAGAAELALPVLLVILAGAGMGMALAGLARTAPQVRNLATILTPALGMLGGGFWPLEVMPGAMQEVARLSPVYWSVEALREGFVYAGSVTGQTLPLSVLALFGALGLAVGVQGLRRLAP